jgi:hypothetical protein
LASIPIFTDIADAIRQQLQTATTEILVNVPWFTDQSLFDELVAKAQAGVAVSIGLEDDEINQKASVNHADITRFGGRVYLNQSGKGVGLNHEKYCVIDQRIVLFGSYNWTYRAANLNRESILIMDDSMMAEQYCLRFQEMTQLSSVRCVGPDPHTVATASTALADPGLLLKAEIQLLEAEIAQLKTEKAELENRIEHTANRFILELHDLVVQKLALETQLAAKRAELTDKAADRQKVEQYQQHLDDTQAGFNHILERQQVLETPVDKGLLKKLYREACMLAHPDKFMDQPHKQQQANELMAQLAEAYRQKNLAAVEAIWQRLQDGTAFGFDWHSSGDSNTLHRIRDALVKQKADLLAILDELHQSFIGKILVQYSDLNEYIALQRQQLQADVEALKNQLNT